MKNTFFKIIYIVLVIFNLSFIQGCKESNLTDLNKDLNSISYVIPDFSFSTAIIESNPGEQYRSLGQGLQYFSTYQTIVHTVCL